MDGTITTTDVLPPPPPATPRGETASRASALGLVAGGALAIAGSVLTWTTLSLGSGRLAAGQRGGVTAGSRGAGRTAGSGGGLAGRLGSFLAANHSVSGLRVPEGQIVLGLGVGLILLGILALLVRRADFLAALGALGLVVAAVGLVLGIAAALQPPGVAALTTLAPKLATRATVQTGVGAYLAIAGVGLAAMASLGALWIARRSWRLTP
jgi:hypothetical protein